MVYKFKDILSYSQNAPKYQEGLSFVQSGADEKDFSSLNMWLRFPQSEFCLRIL